MRLGLIAAMLMMRAPEDGNGGGGGEGGEPPPEQLPPAEQQQQPAQPTADQRLAALEAANAQLMQQNQFLMQQRGQPTQPQAPGTSDTVDESQLHPDLVKLLRKQEREHAARFDQLRDQFDHQSFVQQMANVNAPPEVAQQANALFASWKQNNMRVLNGNGEPVPPTRADAMRFVMGSMAMEGKLPSFKPGLPAMSGGAMRSGAPPQQAPIVHVEKMTRTERITYYENKLDEEGF